MSRSHCAPSSHLCSCTRGSSSRLAPGDLHALSPLTPQKTLALNDANNFTFEYHRSKHRRLCALSSHFHDRGENLRRWFAFSKKFFSTFYVLIRHSLAPCLRYNLCSFTRSRSFRFDVLVTCAVLPVCVWRSQRAKPTLWNSLAAAAAADTLVAPRATNLTGISLTFFSCFFGSFVRFSWSFLELFGGGFAAAPDDCCWLDWTGEISPFFNSSRILLQPPPSNNPFHNVVQGVFTAVLRHNTSIVQITNYYFTTIRGPSTTNERHHPFNNYLHSLFTDSLALWHLMATLDGNTSVVGLLAG